MFESLMLRQPNWGHFSNQMDRLLSGLSSGDWRFGPESQLARSAFPAMNVHETEGALVAEVELPGLQLEDIEMVLVGNELTLSGEYREPATKDCAFHRRERPLGKFHRSLQLPVDVDAAKVEATLHDGLLKIQLPKAEAAKPRKIEIRAGK